MKKPYQVNNRENAAAGEVLQEFARANDNICCRW